MVVIRFPKKTSRHIYIYIKSTLIKISIYTTLTNAKLFTVNCYVIKFKKGRRIKSVGRFDILTENGLTS